MSSCALIGFSPDAHEAGQDPVQTRRTVKCQEMGISLTEILYLCKDMVVHWDKDDMAIDPAKQALIDKILMATPEQLSMIRSYVDFVMK